MGKNMDGKIPHQKVRQKRGFSVIFDGSSRIFPIIRGE
ncbi:hypothetical protein BSM4216_2940 [Bacillus smithii]|nr:hypothetical protein BSM4216_2940 [Bacillus smithii]